MRSWLPLLYSFICHLFILWLLFKLQFYYSVCEVLWLPRVCRVLIPFEKNLGCFFKGFWPYGLLDSKGLKSLPFSCPRWNHTGGMAVSGSALLLHVREFDGLSWRHLGSLLLSQWLCPCERTENLGGWSATLSSQELSTFYTTLPCVSFGFGSCPGRWAQPCISLHWLILL